MNKTVFRVVVLNHITLLLLSRSAYPVWRQLPEAGPLAVTFSPLSPNRITPFLERSPLVPSPQSTSKEARTPSSVKSVSSKKGAAVTPLASSQHPSKRQTSTPKRYNPVERIDSSPQPPALSFSQNLESAPPLARYWFFKAIK